MRRSSLCCRDYCCWRVGLAGCAPCRQLKDSRISQTQHHPADKPILAWQAAARALVIRELLLQEARRLDIEAEPAVDSQGRRETDDEASIRYLMESEVSTPEPDEATCRRYYERHPAHFRSPALYEAAHILFAARKDEGVGFATARARAETVLAQLREHPDQFGELARLHSACPSAAQDGNLGQIGAGQTTLEFEEALFALVPGAVTERPMPPGTACTSSISTARSRAADCLSHWWPIASPIICAKVSGVAPRRNTSRG